MPVTKTCFRSEQMLSIRVGDGVAVRQCYEEWLRQLPREHLEKVYRAWITYLEGGGNQLALTPLDNDLAQMEDHDSNSDLIIEEMIKIIDDHPRIPEELLMSNNSDELSSAKIIELGRGVELQKKIRDQLLRIAREISNEAPSDGEAKNWNEIWDEIFRLRDERMRFQNKEISTYERSHRSR